jgi:hypothetical protein
MDPYAPPKADAAILAYLAGVITAFGLFAWAFYAVMQPRVLPNAGLANYKEPGRTTIFLHKIDTSAERMESAAIATAETSNREQGLSPLRAYASATPGLAASNGAGTKSVASAAKQVKQQVKPKRVVRREPVVADPWRQNQNLAFGSNGWFGPGGGRPFWPGGRWQ